MAGLPIRQPVRWEPGAAWVRRAQDYTLQKPNQWFFKVHMLIAEKKPIKEQIV